MTTIATVTHPVNRLTIPIDEEFVVFRGRYEAAVPAVDYVRMAGLVADRAPWTTVLQDTAAIAPHGFLRYWTLEVAPIMGLAGHTEPCVEYLMGNHTIAERMYRHDPAAMLYAPLRTVLHEDERGAVRFVVDQPSTHFASFGVTEITAVGEELDRLLAELLSALGAPVPSVLE